MMLGESPTKPHRITVLVVFACSAVHLNINYLCINMLPLQVSYGLIGGVGVGISYRHIVSRLSAYASAQPHAYHMAGLPS